MYSLREKKARQTKSYRAKKIREEIKAIGFTWCEAKMVALDRIC